MEFPNGPRARDWNGLGGRREGDCLRGRVKNLGGGGGRLFKGDGSNQTWESKEEGCLRLDRGNQGPGALSRVAMQT